MAEKPLVVPRWNLSGDNRLAPSAGEIDAGHAFGGVPSSGRENHLKFYTGEWLEYLKDGSLSGDHSVEGNLAVQDDITVIDGFFKRPFRPLVLPASCATLISGTGTLQHTGSQWRITSTSAILRFPILLPEGDEVGEVGVYLACDAGAVATLALRKIQVAIITPLEIVSDTFTDTSMNLKSVTPPGGSDGPGNSTTPVVLDVALTSGTGITVRSLRAQIGAP